VAIAASLAGGTNRRVKTVEESGERLENAQERGTKEIRNWHSRLASYVNGQQLEVNSTPAVFVNGRRLVGADPHAHEQYRIAQPGTGRSA